MKLHVSSSPHVGSKLTTQKIMLHMCIALLFPTVAGVIIFGLYSLVVVLTAVVSAVLAEMLYNKMTHTRLTINDLSAVVTGMILGLNLPPSVPLYVPVVGSVFAIMLVKMLFGGIGRNFANPAATARLFLVLSWAAPMRAYMQPLDYTRGFWEAFLSGFTKQYVTSATPLAALKTSGATGVLPDSINLLDLFLGRIGGSIGEVCAIAILLGFVYLMVFKIIDWKIPTIYLLACVLSALLMYNNGWLFVLPTLLSGGLLFGAVYMLTDYSTSPNTLIGKIIFAAGAGIFTVLFRSFSGFDGGVSIAILLMNLVVPLLDKIVPKPFGYKKPNKEEACA